MKEQSRVKASVLMYQAAAEVGDRLRQMRLALDLSQLAVAQQLRISRERITNYEDGRTPLKVEVGLAACRQFIYSEKWLATGDGDPRLLMNLHDDPIAAQVKPGVFFATAYQQTLAARYDELAAQSGGAIRFPPHGEDLHRDCQVMSEFLLIWQGLLPPEKCCVLMEKLLSEGNAFCVENILPSDLANPAFLAVSDARESVAFVDATIRAAHVKAAAKRLKKKTV